VTVERGVVQSSASVFSRDVNASTSGEQQRQGFVLALNGRQRQSRVALHVDGIQVDALQPYASEFDNVWSRRKWSCERSN
jgi:hypothetical protein